MGTTLEYIVTHTVNIDSRIFIAMPKRTEGKVHSLYALEYGKAFRISTFLACRQPPKSMGFN